MLSHDEVHSSMIEMLNQYREHFRVPMRATIGKAWMIFRKVFPLHNPRVCSGIGQDFLP
jgi:hypothetical protein